MSVSIKTGTVEDFDTSQFNSDGTWYTIKFQNPYLSTVTPKVFAQIQTTHGDDTPGLRIQNVTHEGFQVSMRGIYSSDTVSSELGEIGGLKTTSGHISETLAWLAIN